MANKIGSIDLGMVQSCSPVSRRPLAGRKSGGLSYWQNVVADALEWRITGYLKSPTLAQKMSLIGLKHGLPALVDLDSFSAGFLCWGRVAEIFPRPSRIGDVFYYDIMLKQVPAVGVTYVQTAEAWLHDLDYEASYRVVNPLMGRHAISATSDRLDWTWQVYLDNDKDSIQTAILEFQVGDDIDKLKIWGWKDLSPHAWSLIGDWGGADAWDASKTFTDDDSIAHVFKLNKGARGETLSGIGTASNMLGLTKRCLTSITLMQAQSGSDLSTDHSLDQLLLKVTAEHTLREAARSYPRLTYVDGSLGPGVA